MLFLFVLFWGHAWWCSGMAPGSELKEHSWWCLGGSSGVPGIESRVARCKAGTLPAVLSLSLASLFQLTQPVWFSPLTYSRQGLWSDCLSSGMGGIPKNPPPGNTFLAQESPAKGAAMWTFSFILTLIFSHILRLDWAVAPLVLKQDRERAGGIRGAGAEP